MCVVLMKFGCTTSAVTYGINCVASLPFTYSLPWPHGKVKCPLDAHFRISLELVGHLGTFRLLVYEHYDFGHMTWVLVLLWVLGIVVWSWHAALLNSFLLTLTSPSYILWLRIQSLSPSNWTEFLEWHRFSIIDLNNPCVATSAETSTIQWQKEYF